MNMASQSPFPPVSVVPCENFEVFYFPLRGIPSRVFCGAGMKKDMEFIPASQNTPARREGLGSSHIELHKQAEKATLRSHLHKGPHTNAE